MATSVACPVLMAWAGDEHLLARLVSSKGLVIVTEDTLTRQTVVDNRALVDPLVKHVGISPALLASCTGFLGPSVAKDCVQVWTCARSMCQGSTVGIALQTNLCLAESWLPLHSESS